KHQQQPIEVITNILLRHRVLHEQEQFPERLLGQDDFSQDRSGIAQLRKVAGRQGLQVEPAFTSTDLQPVVLCVQYRVYTLGQRSQNILQLACRNRETVVFTCCSADIAAR